MANSAARTKETDIGRLTQYAASTGGPASFSTRNSTKKQIGQSVHHSVELIPSNASHMNSPERSGSKKSTSIFAQLQGMNESQAALAR